MGRSKKLDRFNDWYSIVHQLTVTDGRSNFNAADAVESRSMVQQILPPPTGGMSGSPPLAGLCDRVR
jgi:hypothetical protein